MEYAKNRNAPRCHFHTFLAAFFAAATLFAEPAGFPGDFPVLVEDPPDNSAAYAMFYRAGLVPVPPHARLVRYAGTRGGDGRWTQPHFHTFSHGMFGRHPDTWFWLDEDGAGRLLRDNRIVEDIPVHLVDSRGGAGSGQVGMLVMDVDLVRETRALFEQIIRSREDSRRVRVDTSGPDAAGQLMIFAVRLHETGHTHIANQITAHLFETTGRRETLLAALSVLVDHEHERNLETFLSDGDFPAFINVTEKLLNEKQNVWFKRDIVLELLEEWKAASTVRPEPPADFNEAQARLFRAVLDLGADGSLGGMRLGRFSHENWLLAPARLFMAHDGRGGEPRAEGSKAFVEALKAAETDAIPVLLALAETEWFLPSDARSVSLGGGFYRIHGQDVQRQQLLMAFPRPAKSSEIAALVLRGILPSRRRPGNPGDVLAAAADVHQAVAGMSNLEIAWWYLENVDSINDAPPAALYTILATRRDDQLERLRELVLGDKDPVNVLSRYLDSPLTQGAKGEAFLESLPEKLREIHAVELADPDAWRAKPVREFLAKLEARASPSIPLLQVVDEVLANNSSSLRAIGINPGELPSTEADLQRTLLSGLARATSIEQAEILWGLYTRLAMSIQFKGRFGGVGNYMLAMYAADGEGEGSFGDEIEEPRALKWAPVAELWLPLLQNRDGELESALATFAAIQLLYRLEDDSPMGEALWEFPHEEFVQDPHYREAILDLLARVLADPGEETLALLPTPEKIPEARREQILSILRGDDQAALRELLETSDLSEAGFVFDEIFELWDENPPALRALSAETPGRITHVFAPGFDGLDAIAGETLNEDALNKLLNHAREFAIAGKSGMLVLMERPLLRGFTLTAVERKMTANEMGMGLEWELTDGGVVLEIIDEMGAFDYERHFSLKRPISLADEPESPGGGEFGFDIRDMFPDEFADHKKQLDKWLASEEVAPGDAGQLLIHFAPAKAETN